MRYLVGVCCLVISVAALSLGCNSGAATCGEGEKVALASGQVCVYQESIVIETGFSCPEQLPYLHGGDGTFVCSADKQLSPDDISDINEELGEDERFRDPSGGSTGTDTSKPGWEVDTGSQNMDLLFVIDNSGSMCEEQEDLAKEFSAFLAEIDFDQTDLNIGVTTTHQAPEELNAEFAAQYGRLESTPNPIPSTFGACGRPETVEVALERAVGCTKEPTQFRTELTPDERACLDDRASATCIEYCTNNAGEAWCEADGTFDPNTFKQAIFPEAGDYRDFDNVLRTSDFRGSNGRVQAGLLAGDFSCISQVGTSGWSFEKGLGAAVEAVSPEKTSGVNSGFIREDADFGVVFVTDENDCTHDGSIEEVNTGACRDDVCAFENSTQLAAGESALVSLDDIKSRLLANLRQSKGEQRFADRDVFVAGIYGQPDRYEGPSFTREECASGSYETIPTTCSSNRGTAFSGDRYDRFLSRFDARFPEADDPVRGKVCVENFGAQLRDIGAGIRAWRAGETDQ